MMMAMKSLKVHTRHEGRKEEGRPALAKSRKVFARGEVVRLRPLIGGSSQVVSSLLATPTPLTAAKSLSALILPDETSCGNLAIFAAACKTRQQDTNRLHGTSHFVSYQLAVGRAHYYRLSRESRQLEALPEKLRVGIHRGVHQLSY